MRSSFVSAAILAFSSTVFATDPTPGFDPITTPFQDQSVPAGKPFDIVWEPSTNYTGTITIQLLQGATTSTLSAGDVIKAGIDNSVGTYTWDVPTSLQSFATYGFTIIQDTNTTCFQYSFPFHITGLAGGSSATYSGTTSTVTKHLSTGSNYVASSTIASNSSTSAATPTPSSNVTLSTTITTKTSASNTIASATTSSSSAPAQSKNAAVAQVATGSLAMFGGLVLALAL